MNRTAGRITILYAVVSKLISPKMILKMFFQLIYYGFLVKYIYCVRKPIFALYSLWIKFNHRVIYQLSML